MKIYKITEASEYLGTIATLFATYSLLLVTGACLYNKLQRKTPQS